MKDPVCRLKKALYGHPRAGDCWHDRLHSVLIADGFETVEAIASAATGSSGFHQDVPLQDISIMDTKVTTE